MQSIAWQPGIETIWSSIHSFFHSLNSLSGNIYNTPGIVLETGYRAENKTGHAPTLSKSLCSNGRDRLTGNYNCIHKRM